MKRLIAVALSTACIFSGGCASIVHGGPRVVPIASDPPGATVSIYNRSNTLVMTDTTPFVAKLPTRYAYFKGQSYRLVFELAGHQSAEVQLVPRVSGWYFANFVIGGPLGLFVIDPLTGAMYNLSPDKVSQTLTPAQAQVLHDGTGFVVLQTSQITDAERAAMVRVH